MFERSYTILPSDAGAQGIIKPRNLIDCLQDTADMAVAELKADVHSVAESGYAWILVHEKISVDRWPKLSEKITIRTWHNVSDGPYTFRAFELRSEDNTTLMNGSTSWLLLDVARSRAVKPKKILPQIFVHDGEKNPYVPNEFTELPREHSLLSENSNSKSFEVRLHDLDSNDHVNNAVYIEWAVESVPREISTNNKLSGWDVIYRKGAYLGEEVIVSTREELNNEKNSQAKIFTGTMKTGETFLCTARTYWKR
jgi:medium-chain acyl-[acyl-carrier-protein] hydrolase